MARIYFVTGIMDHKRKIGEPQHKIIHINTSNYRRDLDKTLKFIRERMIADDFLSITITKDAHNDDVDNGSLARGKNPATRRKV